MIHTAWSDVFNFSDYGEVLSLVRNALVAGAVLGLLGGLVGVFVIARDLPFAVHGVSELSFAGASGALLLGIGVVAGAFTGSMIAALLIGLLGIRARDRNSIIGVLMPFGLGLGILFLSLYHGRTANKFGLLIGQIVSIDDTALGALLATSAVVLGLLLVLWRPLMFASVDPEVAEARGVPVRILGVVFLLLLGAQVAVSVQVIGALLVLTLFATPAAAALQVSSSPVVTPLLSAGFSLTSMLGGILLAAGGTLPISPYVTTISFLIYLACRVIGTRRRTRRADPEPA